MVLFCDSILIVVALEKRSMIPFRSVTHWGPPWSRSIEFLFSSFNCPEYVSSSRNGKQGVQREDVHRILFPCSLFSFFFFSIFSLHRTLFLSKTPRFSRQTIHSKFVSGFTFPLCEKRQRNLAFFVVYARHILLIKFCRLILCYSRYRLDDGFVKIDIRFR